MIMALLWLTKVILCVWNVIPVPYELPPGMEIDGVILFPLAPWTLLGSPLAQPQPGLIKEVGAAIWRFTKDLYIILGPTSWCKISTILQQSTSISGCGIWTIHLRWFWEGERGHVDVVFFLIAIVVVVAK